MEIKLNNLFGNSINSRAAIRNVLENNCSCPILVLDFEDIIFISRSAAHQLIIEKKDRKSLQLINLNSNVKKMLDVIEINLRKSQLNQVIEYQKSTQARF